MSTVQFAGFSRLNGVLKFRTANEISRAQQLAKLGDTDISMALLPNPMTKNDAAKYVLTNLAVSYPRVNQAEAEALLTGLIKDENPFARPKAVKKSKTVKAKNARLIIGSVSVGADDAPYTAKQAAKIRAEFMKKLKVAYEAN
jgi:hypothetical protein